MDVGLKFVGASCFSRAVGQAAGLMMDPGLIAASRPFFLSGYMSASPLCRSHYTQNPRLKFGGFDPRRHRLAFPRDLDRRAVGWRISSSVAWQRTPCAGRWVDDAAAGELGVA